MAGERSFANDVPVRSSTQHSKARMASIVRARGGRSEEDLAVLITEEARRVMHVPSELSTSRSAAISSFLIWMGPRLFPDWLVAGGQG